MAVSLIAGGVIHGLRPQWFTLDWPSVALIFSGILIWLVPDGDFGSIFESIKFGNNHIIFRNTEKLREEVDMAARAAVKEVDMAAPKGVFVGRSRTTDSAENLHARREAVSSDQQAESGPETKIDVPPQSLDDDIGTPELLASDKELALIELGVEIERAINMLLAKLRLRQQGQSYPPTKAVELLRENGLITVEMAQALIQFQQVRNEIVHAGRNVPGAAITSAIDSGLKMLQLLKSKLRRIAPNFGRGI